MAGTGRSTPKVLLIQDQTAVAEAIELVLERGRRFDVRVASSSRQGVPVAAREHPEVIVVDLDLASEPALVAMRKVLEAHPAARPLVLSGRKEDPRHALAVEGGAVGILSKYAPVADMVDGIRRVAAGEDLLEREEADRLLRQLRRRRHQEATERQRVSRLTPRQTEILELMVQGLPSRDIAARLHVSPQTLRTHVNNILTRLGAHSKIEAMALAIRQGKVSAGGW